METTFKSFRCIIWMKKRSDLLPPFCIIIITISIFFSENNVMNLIFPRRVNFTGEVESQDEFANVTYNNLLIYYSM